MKFTTIKTLSNLVYSTRFETDFTTAESELIDDFGDPTISAGGHFYGDTVTYTGSIALNDTITQGSAYGKMVKDGTIHRYTTFTFSVGGLDGSLATLTAISDVSYTISTSYKAIEADFPFTRNFGSEERADIYAAEIKKRCDLVINTLRGNEDTFSTENIETL